MKVRFVCLLGLLFLTSQAAAQSENPPANPRARALELFQQGRLKDAIPELQKSLQKNSGDAEIRLHLAFAYDRLGSVDDAVAEYRRVIELDPSSYFAHNNLGVLYDTQGRFDEAIAAFESAAKLDPKNSGSSRNLDTAKKNKAAIQERQAQLQKAENAAAIKPQDPQASYVVARLHANFGNRELALQWLDRARRQGYKELASVQNDPAFRNFRNDREFELILLGK